MKQHSPIAWGIASKFSHVLASETRDLATHIDEALLGKWRPIETAPKDRNIIITGRYANGLAYVEEGCWNYKGHWSTRKLEPPTHWMPMPEPFGGWDAPLESQ